MAYTYHDANGYLEPGPSINGWRELKALAVQSRLALPALGQLLEHGYTNLLVALAIECRTLSAKTDNQDIKSTLSHLAGLTQKADEIIALES